MKDGVDQSAKFNGEDIQLEGQAGEVKLSGGGIAVSEKLPGGLGSEIEFASLIVAVAEIAVAAEEIGEVDEGDHLRGGMIDGRLMMELDDVADFGGELPDVAEDAAAIAVSEAEGLLLDLAERSFGGSGGMEGMSKLGGEKQRVDEDADIVEEAGEIEAVGIFIAERLREALAEQSGAEGVTPERVGSHTLFGASEELGEAAGVNQVAYAHEAEGDDGVADGFDLRAAAEQGGIGDAQALRGEGFIVGNKLDDMAHVDVGNPFAETFAQRTEDGRHGGEILEFVDAANEDLIGGGVHF
jgi:hypothetical protein